MVTAVGGRRWLGLVFVCAVACSDEPAPAWAPHGDSLGADAAADRADSGTPPSKPMNHASNASVVSGGTDAGEPSGASGSGAAPTFGTTCTAGQLEGMSGFCYTTSNPLPSRHLVQEAANVGDKIRFYPQSGSDDVIVELDAPTQYRAFMIVFAMPGPGHWVPQKLTVPAIFSGEDGMGSVVRFCDDEVETSIDISELVFQRRGRIARASVTAKASCPDGAGDIFARFHIEQESDVLLAADEPCSVDAKNGYCFTSEIGGYAEGYPRVRRDGELTLDGEYAPPRLTITASMDEDIPSIFTMGFAAALPEGLEVGTRYNTTLGFLDPNPMASKVAMSIPTQAACETRSGSFTVNELVLHDVNPQHVVKASIDFEQTCDDRKLVGQVRLDATAE